MAKVSAQPPPSAPPHQADKEAGGRRPSVAEYRPWQQYEYQSPKPTQWLTDENDERSARKSSGWRETGTLKKGRAAPGGHLGPAPTSTSSGDESPTAFDIDAFTVLQYQAQHKPGSPVRTHKTAATTIPTTLPSGGAATNGSSSPQSEPSLGDDLPPSPPTKGPAPQNLLEGVVGATKPLVDSQN
eukprot:TRINITY_DN916_c0_g1_i1.p1 TRINITY_DN916_c0_g1~~TRINITY_DN916_c0_g1_i1.p1  ORF type:complete len:216 (-),score=45.16 TRINITY_DN916_c0_g1_i1:37-591(-)